MSDGSSGNGGSSVNVVAILAMLVLVGVAAWFMWGRQGSTRLPKSPAPATQQDDRAVHVKIDLPDSVTIK